VIKIESLLIEEFRGIRKLQLNLSGQTFAICGPNGTGKSGVVDAIEFALTGDISRLSGEGTDGLTIKAHAPHVDKRNAPQKARVVLTACIPHLGGKVFTLERTVSNAKAPKLSPPDADIQAAIGELGGHPEFALTRREIIKYILATPNNRAKAVQALLRLEEIEKVRTSLNSIDNATTREANICESALAQAKRLLLQALGINDLLKSEVLSAVNKYRAVISLEPLPSLEANTSLKEEMNSATTAKPKVLKQQAKNDLDALLKILQAPMPQQIGSKLSEVRRIFEALRSSPHLLESLKRESFLRSGLALIGPDSCPFCDADWQADLLREHVGLKLDEARQASSLKSELRLAAQPIEEHYRDIDALLVAIQGHASGLNPSISKVAIQSFREALIKNRLMLQALDDIEASMTSTTSITADRSRDVDTALNALMLVVEALPDLSKEDAARDQLTLCQDRLESYQKCKRETEQAKKVSQWASEALRAYSKSVNHVLESIYIAVEADFSTFYKVIHHDDEDEFVGKLVPSLGKLGFDVDFYGRGFFPPGAYHSEGHQDSMGVCLYLALMRHTLKERFTFAVLDDVLMSVDAGHRREVCSLLKQHFSSTQFVITTHDDIWLQHMRTEKIVSSKSFVHFKRWSVEDGPVIWEGNEVWPQIQAELADSGVSTAAGTLRRYLEYISGQLAHKLQAEVPFRGDARWELGELLPSVISRCLELLRKAKAAAHSWQDEGAKLTIQSLENKINAAYARTQAEQWPINASIHYNEWIRLQEEEFKPVALAFEELLNHLRCSTCETFFHVLPLRGSGPEVLRCDCGKSSFNVKKKII
jgi:recombinational DNA repair ATPase RecF